MIKNRHKQTWWGSSYCGWEWRANKKDTGFPPNLKLTSNFLKITAKSTTLQSSMLSKHTIKNDLLTVIQNIFSRNLTNHLHQISQNLFLLTPQTMLFQIPSHNFSVKRFNRLKKILAIQWYQTHQFFQIQTHVILHFQSFHRYLKNQLEALSWNPISSCSLDPYRDASHYGQNFLKYSKISWKKTYFPILFYMAKFPEIKKFLPIRKFPENWHPDPIPTWLL